MKLIILIMTSFFLPFSASALSTHKAVIPNIIREGDDAADTQKKLDDLMGKARDYLDKYSEHRDDAFVYLDSAASICNKNNIEWPSLLHFLHADYFFRSGDYSSSEEQANIALGKALDEGEYDVYVKTLMLLGLYYQRTGFFNESIEKYNESIAFAKKRKLKKVIPSSYRGQANVYNTVNDLENYRSHLGLMAEAGLAEDDTVAVMEAYLLLGTSLAGEIRDFNGADSILRRCVDLSLKQKNTYYTAFASANIGWNYYCEHMYDSAVVNYERSLKYSLKDNYVMISANSYGNLGTINRDVGDSDKALKYYQLSLEYAKKAKDWYTLSWVYNDMHQLYLNRQDTANAYENFVLYKQFNDSVLITRSSQGLTEARVRYEADMHNKEVDILSLRLKNNRLLNIAILGFFILAVIIGLLLFRGSRLKNKRRLSEMNRKIAELTQVNLRQQMNPHFIFNTLNSIQYYMYQHDKLATNNYLTKFSNLMRKVLENSNHTSVSLRDELDAINLYLELESLRFSGKFDYRITVDEEIDPFLFKIPTMLIQPYVENSICHGLMPKAEKGYVNIGFRLDKDHITCTIEDNGIGREAAGEISKQRKSNHNSMGTKIVSSRLDLVNELYGTSLKTVYFDLVNDKGEPEGTRVEIHIPIMT
ncbi:MAG TPA: histidine kinase [Bacteroidales bacterium]|nr:histidine kinase [Bacteroidales bacterium]